MKKSNIFTKKHMENLNYACYEKKVRFYSESNKRFMVAIFEKGSNEPEYISYELYKKLKK